MPAADPALLNAVADELEDLRAGVDAIYICSATLSAACRRPSGWR